MVHVPFVYQQRQSPPIQPPPSPQQAAIYERIEHGNQSILVDAGAGCGKTTLLMGALRRVEGPTFLGSYNKAIAVEIQNKAAEQRLLRSDLRIGTMHSAGLYSFSRTYPAIQINDDKVIQIAEQHPNYSILRESKDFVTKLASFGKQFLIGIKHETDDMKRWEWLVDQYSLESELAGGVRVSEAIKFTIDVFKQSQLLCHQMIDFDDMIYAPLFYKVSMFKNGNVLLDEVQDSSEARIELAFNMLAYNGMFVGAGDEYQSIYAFSGAMNDAMKNVKERFNCMSMPLTVTYRCPKKIVAHANQWMPHLQAKEGASEGIIRPVRTSCVICRGSGKKLNSDPAVACETCKGSGRRPWYIADRPGVKDVVLCRFTAPLVRTAFGLLRNGIACKVEGRDIGKGLIALATRWKVKNLDQLEYRLKDFLERTVRKLVDQKREHKAQEVRDQVDTLRLIIDGVKDRGGRTVFNLQDAIYKLFQDNVGDCITLCTGHRSKGREWPRVYILQAKDRFSDKEWQAKQEDNLKGVMATRSLFELVLVPTEEVERGTEIVKTTAPIVGELHDWVAEILAARSAESKNDEV